MKGISRLTSTFADSRPQLRDLSSGGRFKFGFQSQIAMYETKSIRVLYLNDRKQTAKVHVVVFQAAVDCSSAVKCQWQWR